MDKARLRALLMEYADHLQHEDAVTDDFLTEGSTFQEVLELMDAVADAVRYYVTHRLS